MCGSYVVLLTMHVMVPTKTSLVTFFNVNEYLTHLCVLLEEIACAHFLIKLRIFFSNSFQHLFMVLSNLDVTNFSLIKHKIFIQLYCKTFLQINLCVN